MINCKYTNKHPVVQSDIKDLKTHHANWFIVSSIIYDGQR